MAGQHTGSFVRDHLVLLGATFVAAMIGTSFSDWKTDLSLILQIMLIYMYLCVCRGGGGGGDGSIGRGDWRPML